MGPGSTGASTGASAGASRQGWARGSARWLAWREQVDLDEYERRWDRLAADGQDIHGEANLVMSFGPDSVLDAGCGTGRMAQELAQRGVAVVGVDLDGDMLAVARRRAPEVPWVL